MVKLIAKPLISGLPQTIGDATLAHIEHEGIFIAPSKLKHGQVKATKNKREVWSGFQEAMIFTDKAPKGAVDVSDGWAFFELSGSSADRVLTHLVPMDLEALEVGSSVRTQLGHMVSLIIKHDGHYEIGVMSSFGEFARDEILHILKAVSNL